MTIIFQPKYAYDLTIDEAAWLFGMNNLRRSPLELSSRGMTDQFVERIERFDPELHAFVEVLTDQARADADAADARRYADERLTPLDGVSIAIKDIFDVKGVPTRCGSAARQDAPPADEDAEPVRRLREAGAVILGKTTTQEFAAGVVSAPCRNPWDITRIPGGSSGGSAAAVAAGLATAAIGSDTGGSIRIPAAVTGTVGLKPSYGSVSKRGVFPLAPSLDTVGPITRTVRDAALIFDAILGHDPLDPDSSSVKQEWASDIENDVDLKGYRIGVPRPFFFDRLQTPVGVVTEGVIELAKELGAEVVETPWPNAALARSAAMIINRVETVEVHIDAIRKHPELYGQELRERVQATALFPRELYRKALQVREHVKQSMANLFTEHRLNALLTPTVPGVAVPAEDLFVRYEDGSAEPVTLSYTRLTQPFNATGQPALSIPAGMDENRLPISVQLVGTPFGEAELCRIGSALDKALDWRGEKSPLRMPKYGSPGVTEF